LASRDFRRHPFRAIARRRRDKSSGQREFAPVLARCAITAGANGVFIETHRTDRALSDGPNMIPLKEMPAVLASLLKIWRVSRSF